MGKCLNIGYDESNLQDISALMVNDITNTSGHSEIVNIYNGEWATFIFKLLMGDILSPEFENNLDKFCKRHDLIWNYKIDVVGYVSFKFESLKIGEIKPYTYGMRIESVILYPEGAFETLKEKLIEIYKIGVKVYTPPKGEYKDYNPEWKKEAINDVTGD